MIDRRRFLQFGGLGIAWSAALAGCTSSPRRRVAVTTTSTSVAPTPDAGLLRLASSLEHTAVQVCMTVAAAGVVKAVAVTAIIRDFADHHSDHASFFEGQTVAAGGQPFTTANQAVLAPLQPRIAGLATDADVYKLLYDLEAMAAATYLSMAGGFHDVKLNGATASVGGVEARHVSVWGARLSGVPTPIPGVATRADSLPYPAGGAVETTAGAIAPGTGV